MKKKYQERANVLRESTSRPGVAVLAKLENKPLDTSLKGFECSSCGFEFASNLDTPHCSNCGSANHIPHGTQVSKLPSETSGVSMECSGCGAHTLVLKEVASCMTEGVFCSCCGTEMHHQETASEVEVSEEESYDMVDDTDLGDTESMKEADEDFKDVSETDDADPETDMKDDEPSDESEVKEIMSEDVEEEDTADEGGTENDTETEGEYEDESDRSSEEKSTEEEVKEISSEDMCEASDDMGSGIDEAVEESVDESSMTEEFEESEEAMDQCETETSTEVEEISTEEMDQCTAEAEMLEHENAKVFSSIKVPVLASIKNKDKAKLEFASSDKVIVAMMGNVPVATLTFEECANEYKDMFGKSAFTRAMVFTAESAGNQSCLDQYGFTNIVTKVPQSKVLASFIKKKVKEEKAALEVSRETVNSEVLQCLSIAAAGLNKNFFSNHKHELKATLASTLTTLGVENASSILSNAFAAANDSYHRTLIEVAKELQSQPLTVRNSLAEAIKATASGVNQELSKVEDRLEVAATPFTRSTPIKVDTKEVASTRDFRARLDEMRKTKPNLF